MAFLASDFCASYTSIRVDDEESEDAECLWYINKYISKKMFKSMSSCSLYLTFFKVCSISGSELRSSFSD